MHIDKTQFGFTLVELMITIALFGILASFAIPSYQNMIENARVRTATGSILTGLQIARAEAITRNTNVQLDFRAGSAWTVCISPVGGGNCPAGTTNIQSRSANEGSSSSVTINNNLKEGPYVFDNFGGLDSPAAPITFDIGNSALAGSRDLRVIVSAGGTTRSCDPALDC